MVDGPVAGEGVGHFANALLEAFHGLVVGDFDPAGVILAEVGCGDLEGVHAATSSAGGHSSAMVTSRASE